MAVKIIKCERGDFNGLIDRWNEILSSLGQYSFFQTHEWVDILYKSMPGAKHRHCLLTFSDGVSALLPLLSIPKKWGIRKVDSLPWGTYGGFLGEQALSNAHYAAALQSMTSLFEPVCIITLPPKMKEQNKDQPISTDTDSNRWQSTHILKLDSDFDSLWDTKFQSRNRTAIRKALKRGVQCRFSNLEGDINQFHALYQKACERWQDVETLPDSFFNQLIDYDPEKIKLWLADYEGRIIAADLILYGKGEAQYFAGASDLEFSHLNASKLLMSEIIRDAVSRGYSLFNFGASAGLKGVEQFKRHFGAEKVDYQRLFAAHPVLRFFQRKQWRV